VSTLQTDRRGRVDSGGLRAPNGATRPRFVIAAPDRGLLGALVLAFLRQLYPDSPIERCAPDTASPPRTVTVRLHGGRPRVVVFEDEPPASLLVPLARTGECGLVTVTSREEDFRQAVEGLFDDGTSYITPSLVRALALASIEPEARPARLTRREAEVVRLLGAGCSNKEMALALVVSPNTVRAHLQSISVKFGVSSRAKIAARARSLGLLDGATPWRPARG
jgi:DNA-binding NarL/FixJ family response regulator